LWGQVKQFLRAFIVVRGTYEIMLIFSLLMVVEWIIPGSASLSSMNPHPFWLPVVVLSIQYGSATGLFVAAVATAASWVAGWPAATPDEDFYSYSMRVWREPVLWTLSSLVIGGLRSRQIAECSDLKERLRAAEKQRDTIAKMAGDLQTCLAGLERAVATQKAQTVEGALESLETLRRSQPGSTMAALQASISLWLGGAKCVVYVSGKYGLGPPVDGGGSRCEVASAAALPKRNARIMEAANHASRVLSVLNDSDAELLDGVGIFACPISVRLGDECVDVFVVETIAVDRLTDSTTRAVALVSSSLGEAWRQQIDGSASSLIHLVEINERALDRSPPTFSAAPRADAT
jgi:hypothetical protein